MTPRAATADLSPATRVPITWVGGIVAVVVGALLWVGVQLREVEHRLTAIETELSLTRRTADARDQQQQPAQQRAIAGDL